MKEKNRSGYKTEITNDGETGEKGLVIWLDTMSDVTARRRALALIKEYKRRTRK
jgi:hypothetical protein